METTDSHTTENEQQDTKSNTLNREGVRAFVSAVGGEDYSHNVSGGADRYLIEDQQLMVEYYVDAETGTPMVRIVQMHPKRFWRFGHVAPAEDWQLNQIVDNGNLLTELYIPPDDSKEQTYLRFSGPPAENTPNGIKIELHSPNEDESDFIIEEQYLTT